ncbi:helix-turn-helix domain-containing protein [Actinacidiphila acidipaludis]|uniref:helix-turn-helix domain-containing protein n=1 Tax=Actinacidiphila acidipaludis TaxID=2873382 RepID=UPI0027E0B570|nr:helix-turn-helix domain-containing protein [Streptomyces acidipaludis]
MTTAIAEFPSEIPDANGKFVLLTVEEAADRLRIGRTTCFNLIRTGALESVTIGHLRRVPVDALPEYVARLREAHRAA